MPAASLRFLDVISRRRGGLTFDLARGGLLMLSMPYLAAVSARNAYYDLWRSRARRAGVPVISVGNITVGGTGKTPMAAWIAQRLVERHKQVALLLRGYKAPSASRGSGSDRAMNEWRSQSDEAMVLKRLCPQAAVIINPNRVAGAERAVAGGAEAIVLDDGFQHRRLARDLDVVLIDATRPFGYGHLLPRGLLREPTRSLRRAGVIVLTRSDEVNETQRGLLVAALKRVSEDKPVVLARHRMAGFVDVKGRPVPDADPSAMRAVVFAGIANFDSFRRGLERRGVTVLAAYQYPDHHAYRKDEVEAFPVVAGELEANTLITTEKDAVKLEDRWPESPCPILSPRVGIEMDEADARVVDAAIDRALAKA